MALDGSTDEKGKRVGPGQQSVLFPPPLYHQTHIEAQNEREWYIFTLLPTVISYPFEYSEKISKAWSNITTAHKG